MYLNFEPDYWYKDSAIKKENKGYTVYFEDGVKTYSVLTYKVNTLKEAKEKINYLINKY